MNINELKENAEKGLAIGNNDVIELCNKLIKANRDISVLKEALVNFGAIHQNYPLEVLKILKHSELLKDII